MGTRGQRRARRVLSVVACLLLAACTGESGSASADASAQSAGSSSAATLSPSPSVVASDQGTAPPELAGRWRRSYEGEPLVLTLQGNGYTVQAAGGTGAGRIFVEGDRITFSNSNRCDGTGTYTWGFEDGRLRFTPIGEDPCGRADFLPRATFGRLEP